MLSAVLARKRAVQAGIAIVRVCSSGSGNCWPPTWKMVLGSGSAPLLTSAIVDQSGEKLAAMMRARWDPLGVTARASPPLEPCHSEKEEYTATTATTRLATMTGGA